MITQYILSGAAALCSNFLSDSPIAPAAQVQNNTFNATHGLYNALTALSRISQANLSAEISEAALTALNFERSNWAGTSVRLDPFYADLPLNWTDAPAGSVIKVEQSTNTSLYTIAPGLALSRLIYTTKNANDTVIPASAYVLWPWMPRQFPWNDGLPVIVWAHGTSGWSGECGPSHIRNLWYQFEIFSASLMGYVVVAPDYAGLGLDHDGRGNTIPHQYLSTKAHGYDMVYAMKAARQAWAHKLEKSRYVIMGHSQGGGAAWGAAIVLGGSGSDIEALKQGYLGTIAAAPWTSLHTTLSFKTSLAGIGSFLARIGTGMQSIFPTFSYDVWLSETGVRIIDLLQDLQGCQSAALELLSSPDMVHEGWNETWYANAFNKLTTNVAMPFAGPLLIIQGTADAAVNSTGVSAAVDATCAALPDSQLEYIEFEGVSHSPVMYAGQQVWLGWIEDRFAGKKAPDGCHRAKHEPLLDVSDYQKDRNWYLEWNQYAYGVA